MSLIARQSYVSPGILFDIPSADNRGVEDPLLEDERPRTAEEDTVSVPQLFASSELRRPLAIVCLAMICQQISGGYYII